MYKDCDIPARLFFKIIETNDYSLLGEGTAEEREKAFDDIFDEFYELKDNKSITSLYAKRRRIMVLEYKKHAITTILHAVYCIAHTQLETFEHLYTAIDILNSTHKGLNFKKSEDISEINKEVERVQTVIIGNINNDIKALSDSETNSKEKQFIRFTDELAKVCTGLGITLSEDITLRMYISYEKLFIERAKALNKANKNG